MGASAGVAQGGVRCERAKPARWPDPAVPAGGQALQGACWSRGPGEGAAGPEGGCSGGGRAADPGPAPTPPPVFGWIHFLTDELLVLRIPLSPSTRQARAVPGPGLLSSRPSSPSIFYRENISPPLSSQNQHGVPVCPLLQCHRLPHASSPLLGSLGSAPPQGRPSTLRSPAHLADVGLSFCVAFWWGGRVHAGPWAPSTEGVVFPAGQEPGLAVWQVWCGACSRAGSPGPGQAGLLARTWMVRCLRVRHVVFPALDESS